MDGPAALMLRIQQILALDPAAPAMEFERQWHSWGEIADAARVIGEQVEPGERVALLLRNRPHHVGLLIGLIAAGACVVTVNPGRGSERVRRDVAGLGVGTIAGESTDLKEFAPAPLQVRWMSSESLGFVQLTDRVADLATDLPRASRWRCSPAGRPGRPSAFP
jgi:acyl-CoA synthetase (AMP-forming)/AMP-acid ligase II